MGHLLETRNNPHGASVLTQVPVREDMWGGQNTYLKGETVLFPGTCEDVTWQRELCKWEQIKEMIPDCLGWGALNAVTRVLVREAGRQENPRRLDGRGQRSERAWKTLALEREAGPPVEEGRQAWKLEDREVDRPPPRASGGARSVRTVILAQGDLADS